MPLTLEPGRNLLLVELLDSCVITKKKIIDIPHDMYNNKYMYNIKEDLK